MKKLLISAFVLAVGAFGVVVSIDSSGGNITLSHGPMPHLGMPGMTMGFRAAEPGLLEGIKPGDRVRFDAGVVDGAFTVTKLESVK